MFKHLVTAMKKLINLWPGTWGAPIAVMLWVLSETVIRWYDPTAATFDPGVLQTIVYPIIGVLVFNDLAFMGIKFNFPAVWEFYVVKFKGAFNNLSIWHACLFLLALFVTYMLAFVLLAQVLSGIVSAPAMPLN